MPIEQGRTWQDHNWARFRDWPQIGPQNCPKKRGKKAQKAPPALASRNMLVTYSWTSKGCVFFTWAHTIRNAWITILIPLEYFDVMNMKSLRKLIPPRIFWCNDYVSHRRWCKRCRSDKLREIIRPEFFDVNLDEIITKNNSLRIKWWNVILEFRMVYRGTARGAPGAGEK